MRYITEVNELGHQLICILKRLLPVVRVLSPLHFQRGVLCKAPGASLGYLQSPRDLTMEVCYTVLCSLYGLQYWLCKDSSSFAKPLGASVWGSVKPLGTLLWDFPMGFIKPLGASLSELCYGA